ncbi:hypothetical protein Prum_038820 [Phytohabitans rumicis]|uniref:histidine kinase n=1 Tax=Phytohabitans rumicis TaxID=1076125 RepID=A0A6V8L3X5_9ACTN|nr:hypothetical protein Prum_038820 [Phytohabitans rumicis]
MKLPRWRHWTLRSRLVVVAAALTAVALIVANAAGLLLLRRYLTDQIDDQLVGMSRMAQRERPPPSDSFIEPNPESDPFPSTKFDPYKVMLSFNAEGERVRPRTVDSAISLPDLEAFDKLTERAGGAPYTVQSADGESSWRVVVVSRDSGGVAVAAISLRQVDATADLLLVIDLAVMFIVLLLLGMVAASVVRIGLRPLTQMERTSAEITAGDLSSRVDDADPHTEPGRLGIAINSMLDRIESEVAARTASEQRIRQFVADASHELRTPLTSIRGFAELYRRGGTRPAPCSTRPWPGSRPRPPGWGSWSKTCCCWPSSTGSASRSGARSTCSRSPPTPSAMRTPAAPTGRCGWPGTGRTRAASSR